jgi:hypothetical protein
MNDTETSMNEHNDRLNVELYPMEPPPHEKYSKSLVEAEVMKLLQSEMENQKYNASTSIQTSKELCSKILAKVKELGYKRYKFVVQVVITSSSGQGIRVASRCLWDPAKDNFASVVYKNVSIKMLTIFLQ